MNKAELGILLGYTQMGYRVLVNNRVIDARHVDIIEKNEICIGIEEDNERVNNTSINEEDDEQILKRQTKQKRMKVQ